MDVQISKFRLRDAFGTRDVVGVIVEEVDQGQHRIAVLDTVVGYIDEPPTVLFSIPSSDELDSTAATLVALDERVVALEHPGT